MAVFKVCVVQGYRVQTEIIMEVEAEDLQSAIELVDSGAVDKPDLAEWKKGWELMNEEVTAA